MAYAIACRVLGLRDLGPALAPMNAFLILTGIETLPLRMQRHCDNALAVAKWLQAPSQGRVGELCRPRRTMRATACTRPIAPKARAAIFTFGVKGGYEAGKAMVNSVKLFSHLANIGDTRSLIIHPASTTHRQLEPDQRAGRRRGRRRRAPLHRHRERRGHHRRSGSGAGRVTKLECLPDRRAEQQRGGELVQRGEAERRLPQQRRDAETDLKYARLPTRLAASMACFARLRAVNHARQRNARRRRRYRPRCGDRTARGRGLRRNSSR